LNKTTILAIVLFVLGVTSLVAVLAYTSYQIRPYSNWRGAAQGYRGMMSQWYPQSQYIIQPSSSLTIQDAKAMAQQYLASTQNPNLDIEEIMEFQSNFYIIYYEKNTDIAAFEMLIWKQAPTSGMMGGGMMGGGYVSPGVIVPEPGPNMMWNTKYSPMNNWMMNSYGKQGSSTMTISTDRAAQLAQAYLDSNFSGGKIEMVTEFYGYYTFDFTVNGNIAGMLSVNGYTGQVWYHSWHGAFIQEIEFD